MKYPKKLVILFLIITTSSFGQIDKLQHFSAGFVISETTYLITGDKWVTFGLATSAGILKEVNDSRGFGQPELLDAVATSVGGLAPIIIHSNWQPIRMNVDGHYYYGLRYRKKFK